MEHSVYIIATQKGEGEPWEFEASFRKGEVAAMGDYARTIANRLSAHKAPTRYFVFQAHAKGDITGRDVWTQWPFESLNTDLELIYRRNRDN